MKLLSKTKEIFNTRIKGRITQEFEKGEGRKAYYLRLGLFILSLNLFAIIALADLSPLKLLNPTRFLQKPPLDQRVEVTLYYPKSRQGLEVMDEKKFPQDYIVSSRELVLQEIGGDIQIGASSGGSREPDMEAQKEAERGTKETPQGAGESEAQRKVVEQNIVYILLRLSQDPVSLSGRKLYRDKAAIKKVWYYDNRAIIHLAPHIFEGMQADENKIFQNCIELSIQENLPSVEEVEIII